VLVVVLVVVVLVVVVVGRVVVPPPTDVVVVVVVVVPPVLPPLRLSIKTSPVVSLDTYKFSPEEEKTSPTGRKQPLVHEFSFTFLSKS